MLTHAGSIAYPIRGYIIWLPVGNNFSIDKSGMGINLTNYVFFWGLFTGSKSFLIIDQVASAKQGGY